MSFQNFRCGRKWRKLGTLLHIVSKVLPVGNCDLSVESSVLNVHLEKKLLEVHNGVTFISHINVTDQGQIIKDYYKEDQLHLSIRGVLLFGGDLHKSILESLTKQRGGTILK